MFNFIIWFCLLDPSPLPTPEIHSLIKKLGDDKYLVRQTAHQKLEDLGFKAYRALTLATHHPDLEVRTRAYHLLTSYMCVNSNITIFSLVGVRIHTANGYYKLTLEQAMELYKQTQQEIKPFYDRTHGRQAAELYARFLLTQGANKTKLVKVLHTEAPEQLPPEFQ